MSTDALPAAYSSPLRDEQKDATRRRILDAAGRLMQAEGVAAVSYQAIAKAAGVQERTVYRHFPNREALFEGLWQWLDPRIGLGSFPTTEEELLAAPRRVFPAFDENENMMRAFWSTPQGRDFRLRVNGQRQAAFRKAIASSTGDLPAREARWLCAVAQLLYSGAAWQTMKDYWGFTGKEAGEASSFALALLLEGARRGGAATTRTPPTTKPKKSGERS